MSNYIFHKDLINRLSNNNINNYIIYGNIGSGKRFVLKSLLKNKLNINIDKSKLFVFDTKINNVKYDINIYKSLYHYDLFINKNTSTYENIIINFVKEYCQSKNIINNYNIFIFNNFNNLNHLQMIISNFIENTNHKFIFLTNNYSSIINNLKSKCIFIRVPIPNIKNHLSLLNISEIKQKIILDKYSYNLNIYFECLDIIDKDNFEEILENNKINKLFEKLVHNLKLKRLNSLNNLKEIINDLLLFNNFNLFTEFYNYLYTNKVFKKELFLDISKEFSKIESLSKLGNNNIIYFENLIIYLKMIYFSDL